MKNLPGRSCFKLCVFVCVTFLCSVWARGEDWKTEKSRDGKIQIRNRMQTIYLNGEKVDVVEYEAITKTRVEQANFIAAMKKSETHQFILDNKSSLKLKSISDHEWIFYYFFDFPWPMSDADCVVHMELKQDSSRAEFILNAAPDQFPRQAVQRMPVYNVTYSLQKMDYGISIVSIHSEISSTMNAPDLLVQLWFPEGPADLLRRLITASQKPITP